MMRVYVIMKDTELDGVWDTSPYDVVFSMARAEDVCFEEEQKSSACGENAIFYWREVISSEN